MGGINGMGIGGGAAPSSSGPFGVGMAGSLPGGIPGAVDLRLTHPHLLNNGRLPGSLPGSAAHSRHPSGMVHPGGMHSSGAMMPGGMIPGAINPVVPAAPAYNGAPIQEGDSVWVYDKAMQKQIVLENKPRAQWSNRDKTNYNPGAAARYAVRRAKRHVRANPTAEVAPVVGMTREPLATIPEKGTKRRRQK